MDKLIAGLEEIARAVKTTTDVEKIKSIIQGVRDLKPKPDLDAELATWQSKLTVILKESVGREGMAKHARYWAEKIKNGG